MYIEFSFFKKFYYLQLGREVGSRSCAYLISWGQLWFDDHRQVEYASLNGLFSCLK